jgi:hypothetical protein
MQEILQYLKAHGEQFDTELVKVRLHLSELAGKGDVMTCHSIRFEKGKKIEGIRCRLAGYVPPLAPGRKPKSQLKLS